MLRTLSSTVVFFPCDVNVTQVTIRNNDEHWMFRHGLRLVVPPQLGPYFLLKHRPDHTSSPHQGILPISTARTDLKVLWASFWHLIKKQLVQVGRPCCWSYYLFDLAVHSLLIYLPFKNAHERNRCKQVARNITQITFVPGQGKSNGRSRMARFTRHDKSNPKGPMDSHRRGVIKQRLRVEGTETCLFQHMSISL